MPPIYSTITLFAELIVSIIIYYTLFQGYKHNRFPAKLAGFALLYELVFNISYMFSRVSSQIKATHMESPFIIGLAIVHGTLSLIMFITLIVFFILAWRSYKKGNNYFAKYKLFTFLFLFFWTFSIISGILFYLLDYIV